MRIKRRIYKIVLNGDQQPLAPAEFSDVEVAPEGVYYTPFAGTSNEPHGVLIPWHRIHEVQYHTLPRNVVYRD